MASPVKLYQNEMHNNLGFFATWFPGDPMEIGDAGVLVGGRFRRESSLRDLGIAFEVEAGAPRQSVQYTSTQGTTIKTTGNASGTGIKGEVSIAFARAGAFVFQVSSLRPMRISNQGQVAEQVLNALAGGGWKPGWLLVEALHVADRASIIVSEDSSAGLVLEANADVSVPGISLVDPKIAFTVTATRGKLLHVIGAKGLHPLYSCVRVRTSWFGPASVTPVRGSTRDELPFARPAIDELLDS
jgi:hypothetical protein